MIKILCVAIILGIILAFLKSINSEIFTMALIASGIVLLLFSLSYIQTTYDFINEIISKTNLNTTYYTILIKIIAVSYLTEFTSSSLIDIGLNSLSNKLIFIAKIVIFVLSIPIIYGVINLVSSILQ